MAFSLPCSKHRRGLAQSEPHTIGTKFVFCEHGVSFIFRWEHQGLADSRAIFYFLIDKRKKRISKFGKVHTHTHISIMCLYDRNK